MRLIRGTCFFGTLFPSLVVPQTCACANTLLIKLIQGVPKKRRVHNSLIYRRILTTYLYTQLLQIKWLFICEVILFFSNSDRGFYSENNSESQVYTYTKKNELKNATIVYALHFALNIGGIFVQSLCYYLSFVFPANLIWFNLEALRAIREFIKPFCSLFTTI
jgi:hypothetical protein